MKRTGVLLFSNPSHGIHRDVVLLLQCCTSYTEKYPPPLFPLLVPPLLTVSNPEPQLPISHSCSLPLLRLGLLDVPLRLPLRVCLGIVDRLRVKSRQSK